MRRKHLLYALILQGGSIGALYITVFGAAFSSLGFGLTYLLLATVELKRYQIAESAWPDSCDVRVFNHQGQAVPFALQPDIKTENKTEHVPLHIFTIEETSVSNSRKGSITLKTNSGMAITLPTDNQVKNSTSYLLEVPVQSDKKPSELTKIKLVWNKLPNNWQTRVTLLYSEDLKHWHSESVSTKEKITDSEAEYTWDNPQRFSEIAIFVSMGE